METFDDDHQFSSEMFFILLQFIPNSSHSFSWLIYRTVFPLYKYFLKIFPLIYFKFYAFALNNFNFYSICTQKLHKNIFSTIWIYRSSHVGWLIILFAKIIPSLRTEEPFHHLPCLIISLFSDLFSQRPQSNWMLVAALVFKSTRKFSTYTNTPYLVGSYAI